MLASKSIIQTFSQSLWAYLFRSCISGSLVNGRNGMSTRRGQIARDSKGLNICIGGSCHFCRRVDPRSRIQLLEILRLATAFEKTASDTPRLSAYPTKSVPTEHAINLVATIVSVNEYTAVWTRVCVLKLPVDSMRVKVALTLSFHKSARGLSSWLMFVRFTPGALVPRKPWSLLHRNKRPHVPEAIL